MGLGDWMAAIDGGRRLSELTIPGTHDSGARRGGLRQETQTLDLAAQLAGGVRFLDIRLNRVGGGLRVFHGGADQGLELGAGVVAAIAGFLAVHPGETVVLSVRQEADADPVAFAGAFEGWLAAHPAGFHTAAELPRLDEVRGKIVLLARYAGRLGIAAPPAVWRDDATFAIAAPDGSLQIEDEWQLTVSLPGLFDGKWTAVARHLDAARTGSPADWYLTYTSATGDFAFPRWIARGLPLVDGINSRLADYAGRARGRLGTVVMDFPDAGLIERLVEVNRRA